MDESEKQQHRELAERLVSEQNFTAAVIAGAVATVLAAVAYGIVTTLWSIAYGFAAAGVGIVIGATLLFLGRGVTIKFAYAAALFTILGCILGNVFRAVIALAQARAVSPFDIFRDHPLATLFEQGMSYVSPIDLVYWFVAVFAAVFLARRPLSRAERLAVGSYLRQA